MFIGERRQLGFSLPYLEPYCTVALMGMSALFSYRLQNIGTDPNSVAFELLQNVISGNILPVIKYCVLPQNIRAINAKPL